MAQDETDPEELARDAARWRAFAKVALALWLVDLAVKLLERADALTDKENTGP